MSSAEEMLHMADKKVKSSGGWFTNKQSSLEDAAELYKGAANKFRLDKRYEDSGHAFMKAAETEISSRQPEFASTTYWEASKVFKLVRPELAVTALEKTVSLLLDKGKFRQAADREKSIAELLKNEAQDPEKAMSAYLQAADWYLQEGAKATASSCLREAGQLAAETGQYPTAIEQWEKVATMSLESNLTRYSVKDYYLNAGLCYLAIPDFVACGRAMEFYAQQDPAFPPTMEGRFLNSLLEASESGDLQNFDAIVQDFDRTKRFQGWQASLLVDIRKGLQQEPDLS